MSSKEEFAKRIESEAMAATYTGNDKMVCKDCIFRYELNNGKCEMYPTFPPGKPNSVMIGRPCEYYAKE